MDLRDLDVVSVAGRVAQGAAADLYGVLTCSDPAAAEPVTAWFAPFLAGTGEGLTLVVEQLAAHVCGSTDDVAGERLFRQAVMDGLVPRGEWKDQGLASVASWCLFARTCRGVYVDLRREQLALDAREIRPSSPPLKREDSIDEAPERLDELTDVGKALAAQERAPQQQGGRARDAEPGKGPLSIGERPVAGPRNQGGRPRK